VAELEINNCPPAVRYLLTKGVTHQEVAFTCSLLCSSLLCAALTRLVLLWTRFNSKRDLRSSHAAGIGHLMRPLSLSPALPIVHSTCMCQPPVSRSWMPPSTRSTAS